MLSCRNLSLADRLSDITMSLEPGTVTAICGPNGAGKSTLLQSFAGLLEPDSGEVSLSNTSLAALHPRERAQRIGYLPQEPEVAWDMSVENIVRLGRLPHRDRGAEAVEHAIAALDLAALRNRPITQLSGGERARTLLARVLAGEPQWILADEPLAALDLAHQATLLTHLKRAAQAGAGVALVLHDLSQAMNHADRVIVLNHGRIAANGAPEDALSPDAIHQVWGVIARWLGEPGARALVAKP